MREAHAIKPPFHKPVGGQTTGGMVSTKGSRESPANPWQASGKSAQLIPKKDARDSSADVERGRSMAQLSPNRAGFQPFG